MNGLVAAPLQFIADRCFAGAREAFDQIIPDAHPSLRYIRTLSFDGWLRCSTTQSGTQPLPIFLSKARGKRAASRSRISPRRVSRACRSTSSNQVGSARPTVREVG